MAEGGERPLITGVDPASTPDPGLTVNEALASPKLNAGNRIAAEGIERALAEVGGTIVLRDRSATPPWLGAG